jgi:hypothetical protein
MAGIGPQPDDQEAQAPAPDTSQPDTSGVAPQQGGDEVGDEEGMSPNVSPDEQKQYEEFVTGGLALIYDGEGKAAHVRPGILKLLDNDPSDLRAILNAQELKEFSPLVAIAATTVVVVVELQKLGGDETPGDDIVMHGAVAILEELAEIWMRRNKQQLGEDDVHKALSMAADIYREVGADAGLVDENALKDQFSSLVKADKEGKLAEVSPELAGINKAAEINQTQGDDAQPADQSPDQQAPDQAAPNPDEEQQR